MREPPKFTDAAIVAALYEHYGLPITALTFLPVGADSATYVYRVEASDSAAYFLKLRIAERFSASSLVVPRFLYDRAVPHIIAPLLTHSRELWVRSGDFALSLHPFVDAQTAADAGLSEQGWRTLGATLKQIHASEIAPHVEQIVPQETFVPSRRELLVELEPAPISQNLPDPTQRELAAFWQAHHDQIRTLVNRADALGDQLRAASLSQVLCHADLHTWNVLLDSSKQLWIVDWDETVLSPKERDLMFVIGGIGRDLVSPHETACFLQGYGEAMIDRRALAYYRYAWVVQDMAAYAEQVFSPEWSESTRRDGLDGFVSLFEPGNIVSIAWASDIP